MQIGLSLPTYRRLADPVHIRATAEMAEAYGFHSLWSVDHVVMPAPYADGMVGAHGNLGAAFYDSLTTLAYVAGRTTHVRLGLSIMPIA